jgi:dihydroorotate dehydrogenase
MYNQIKHLLFRLDAEKTHHRVCAGLKILHRVPGLLRKISDCPPPAPVEVAGMRFRNPIGLAAGFDKNADLVGLLPDLGFGFVEIGTVTLQPQVGNAKPRLFRIPETQSLFNRMGFNSAGAGVVSETLRRARRGLPQDFRVGVNLGKNKDTPAEAAANEYAVCASFFENLADYLVVNVSSPNTPGLRNLQTIESISEIVSRIRQVIKRWSPAPSVFVKLAPELDEGVLMAITCEASSLGIDGFVLSNTLQGEHGSQSGGWSGECLRLKSREFLERARKTYKGPIISVGGIMDAAEAKCRRELGAQLIQTYTGWVYSGPRFPAALLNGWNS